MKTIRVKSISDRAGVYYVRVEAMVFGFGVDLNKEFSDDKDDSLYVLTLDGNKPVSTLRIHILEDEKACKIERVATIKSYRGKGYGRETILEAEKWIKEMGYNKIYINSREEALGFYKKLGYEPNYNLKSGAGLFLCVMTSKEI